MDPIRLKKHWQDFLFLVGIWGGWTLICYCISFILVICK